MAAKRRRSQKRWLILVLIALGLAAFVLSSYLGLAGGTVGPVEERAAVTGMVSPRLFWAQPVGSEEPLLVYTPDPPWLKPGDTLQIEGERVHADQLQTLSAEERIVARGEPSLVRAEEIEILEPGPEEASAALDIQEIRIDPDYYAGRDVTGTARVDQIHTDGHLWVLQANGDSIYALVNQPADVLGADLKVKGRVFAARGNFDPLGGQGGLDIVDEGAFLYLEDYQVLSPATAGR